MFYECNLGNISGASLFILWRSFRANAKRLRWSLDSDKRAVARAMRGIAEQLRAETRCRQESRGQAVPALPAEGLKLPKFEASRLAFLADYFNAEAEQYLRLRQLQQQSKLEASIADLKSCAVECAEFDRGLAEAFEKFAARGAKTEPAIEETT